jgi:hypothetical protein
LREEIADIAGIARHRRDRKSKISPRCGEKLKKLPQMRADECGLEQQIG